MVSTVRVTLNTISKLLFIICTNTIVSVNGISSNSTSSSGKQRWCRRQWQWKRCICASHIPNHLNIGEILFAHHRNKMSFSTTHAFYPTNKTQNKFFFHFWPNISMYIHLHSFLQISPQWNKYLTNYSLCSKWQRKPAARSSKLFQATAERIFFVSIFCFSANAMQIVAHGLRHS